MLRGLVEEKNIVIDVLQKDLGCARQERKISNDQEEKLMTEITNLKNNMREDIEKKYLELLQYKKSKDRETEELKSQLGYKNNKIFELQKRVEKFQES